MFGEFPSNIFDEPTNDVQMKKYYVTTGTIREWIVAPSAARAVALVFSKCLVEPDDDVHLNLEVRVSELGHDEHWDDTVFNTELALNICGFNP